MIMYFINLILQFYSRKIFLEYLGTEIIGLNTTAQNILQFLNLAEMGVWTAIASYLYKPIAEGNHMEINRIMTFNGLIYRRIAIFIIVGSLIIMALFPWIFAKMKLPLWYAYASFGALLFSSLLTYFVNYKQFLLSADQKDYKIQLSYKINMSVKVLAQIITISCLSYPFIWWLLCEVFFGISGSVALDLIIRKTYPWLSSSKDSFKSLKKKYPDILLKVKQLFFQKISGYVLFGVSPLIIYAIISMDYVALYGNYMLIVMGMISIMAALFNGMLGSIGNLCASSSVEHSVKVFFQLYSLRFVIISLLSYAIWLFGDQFISIWIGKQYLLSKSTLAIFSVTFFIYVNRYVVYDYISVYGYFGDVWASVTEIVLNIGCSIVLGLMWGLNGILLGVIISLLLISAVWKPIYLFIINLKTGYRQFIKHSMILCICLVISLAISSIIDDSFGVSMYKTESIYWGKFILFCVIDCSLTLFFCHSFRDALSRVIRLI